MGSEWTRQALAGSGIDMPGAWIQTTGAGAESSQLRITARAACNLAHASSESAMDPGRPVLTAASAAISNMDA